MAGLRRYLGFRTGLAAGVLAPIVLVGGVYGFGVFEDRGEPSRPPYFEAMVRSSGAVLSRRGGATVVLKDGYDTITLRCRGVCDDLAVDSTESYYGGYDARVLDAEGACVACDWTPRLERQGMLVTSLTSGGLTKTVPKP